MNEVDFFINEKILNAYNENKRYTIAHGGRGSGKSLQFGALAVIYAINNPNSRILCLRGFQNKISESSLQVLKDVIEMMGLSSYFIITENTLSCKNGSEFLFYGAKSYQAFKSLQGIDLCWVDEATELSAEAWKFLIPTIRNENSRFLVSFNPEKATDWVYHNFIINKHPNASVVKVNYYDNPFFPKVLKDEMENDKATDYDKYLHIWEGQLKIKKEGALWKQEHITYKYEDEEIDYEKVVVSIDPSITATAKSDACGIVVVGLKNDICYVIDDLTRIATPNEWSDIAIVAYDRYGANAIVAEINQGGMMVETIIKNKRKDIPYKGVWSHKGKIVRAEPVQVQYQNGKVVHCKRFPNLEFELLTYDGTGNSPNALDALVIGVTYFKGKPDSTPKGMVKVNLQTLSF